MKRILFLFLFISIIMCTFGLITVSAAKYGDLTYKISDGEVAITACSRGATSVEIPETIENCPVTSISEKAFSYCSKLTGITIPDSVTSIGSYAFEYCTGLTSVTIGEGVTSIDYNAFTNCTGLTGVYIKNIESWCKINFGSFANPLYYAKYLYLDGNLLTDLIIPDGVTSIKKSVFADCISITNVTIPKSITSIGTAAFDGCTGIKNVYISDIGLWCNIKFSNFDSNPLYYAKDLYLNGNLVTDLIIPDSVTSIGKYAFRYYTKLTSISFPDSITSVGKSAFQTCTGLTSVTIGTGVTSIGESAFEDCTGLKTVKIGNNVTDIGSYAFQDCTLLTTITIPDNVTSIGIDAFYKTGYYQYSSSWKNDVLYIGKHLIKAKTSISGNYTIMNECLTIADAAFGNCSMLTSVSIPESVTSIGERAFRSCGSLASIIVNENNPNYCSVNGNLFDKNKTRLIQYAIGKSDANYTIPSSVKSIDSYAFYRCTKLTGITIPGSVTSFGNYAFYDCNGLTSITIPDSVTSIGSYAFYNCSKLTSIAIPDSVISISERAFYYCDGLTSVTIGNGIASIGSYAFYECTGLTRVNINDIEAWCNINFNTYANPLEYAKKLYLNGNLVTDLIIPRSVTSIKNNAFKNCRSLTSVIIPDSVTSIGNSAFETCHQLSSVTIPDSVTSIGESAFENCLQLTSVTIPDSVTSIGDRAFINCSNLISVRISNSVKFIGYCAFEDCSSIEDVYYYGTQADISAVDIGQLNSAFLNNIIYVKHTKTDVSENGKTFSIKPVNIGSGNTVILALYDGNRLIEIQHKTYNGEELPFSTVKSYTEAKVMVWNNLTNLNPVCETENVQ